jgi:uncharacterized phage-associated protein
MGSDIGYDARVVANEFLRIAARSGRRLTNMQLQKLVYIAHGYTLAILHKPLVWQSVEAWRYGPVIKDLYHSLREYGAGIVTQPIPILSAGSLSETHCVIIATVEDAYSRFTGPQLSTMTHKAGTPWAKIYSPSSNWDSEIIPDPLIEEYYLQLLNEREGIGPARLA